MSFIPSEVMDMAAALNNDTAQEQYTDVALLPYFNMALMDLKEEFELNNIPVTNQISSSITVLTGATSVSLPSDLIEIQELFERPSGSTDSFIPMIKKEFLPQITTLTNELRYWMWQGNAIKLLGANADVEVKLNYIRTVFTKVVIGSIGSAININGAEMFLGYRTGALAAMFIGENETRASSINDLTVDALDRALSIPTKGKQAIFTRRRPFRESYKSA